MVDRRLHILTEGQTEETIVREVLEPHWAAAGRLVTRSILKTKLPASGRAHRGGVTSWAKLERENDGPATAPSKRLLRYRPDYTKTLDGPVAVAELGLPGLRGQCPHLDTWLTRIDSRLTAHPR